MIIDIVSSRIRPVPCKTNSSIQDIMKKCIGCQVVLDACGPTVDDEYLNAARKLDIQTMVNKKVLEYTLYPSFTNHSHNIVKPSGLKPKRHYERFTGYQQKKTKNRKVK